MQTADITALITTCLGEVLDEVADETYAREPLGPETALLGRAAVLDSLGLVQLIIEVELQLAERYGLSVTLADERAMSQQRSPFRTVATLADYIMELGREGASPDGA